MVYEPLGYGEFIADLENRFGLNFTCEDTGGGFLLFQARLETGDWIVISDWDAGITPLARRRDMEAEGTTIGWNVSIYANADGDTWPDHLTRLASVHHETATTDELPGIVEQALASLTDNTQHEYHRGGGHTVTHGITHA